MSRKSKAAEFVEEGYNITISGRNVQVTDAMKSYAFEKLSKLERFSNRIIDANIIMDIQKLEHRVDIVVKAGNLLIKSHASSENMYASIDKAVDRIDSQLRRYKARIQDHHARPLESVDMQVNVIRPLTEAELNEINDDIEEENRRQLVSTFKPHPIVNQEKMPLKVLSDDEAVLKMELSGDAFLVYRNESNRKLCVIYRRKDGNYGVMHPEGTVK